MKKNKKTKEFLEQLKRVPIVQVACEKTGISRVSVYKWKKNDEVFSNEMDEALAEGEALINDMTESQLLTMIKNSEWSAVSFWLRHRNPKFKEKVEITGHIKHSDEPMTQEQEKLLKEALRLALPDDQNNNEQSKS